MFNHSGGREGVRTRSARINQVTKDIIKKAIQDSYDNIKHTDSDAQDDEGTWYRKPKMENETKEQSILKESIEREITPSLDETDTNGVVEGVEEFIGI